MRQKDATAWQRDKENTIDQLNMVFLALILVEIFNFLKVEDLMRVPREGEAELYKLDLSGSKDLYHLLPRKMFASVTV